MSNVLEVGHHTDSLARDKAAAPRHIIIGQNSFTSGDEDLAYPSVATTNGSDVDGESGAVGHALGDTVSEAAHGYGSIIGKCSKLVAAIEDGEIIIFTTQRDVSGAFSSGNTNVLEGDAEGGLVANMSVSRRIAVNSDIGTIKGCSSDGSDIGLTLRMGHHNLYIAASGDGRNRDVDSASFTDFASSVKDTILRNANVGTWVS